MSPVRYLALLVVGLMILQADAQRNKKFFRKDYTYLPKSQAFYKIHTIHKWWRDAKRTCEGEGSKLFYAEDQNEINEVIEFWNRTQPFYWVYYGISDLVAKGVFETIDGRPVTDVYGNWGPGEPNDAGGVEDCVILRRDTTLNDDKCFSQYPFICKKSLEDLEWNEKCDMPNLDYVYNDRLGKCYKFHLKPTNWTLAAAVCSAEQSYLTVIDSQEEADFLVKFTAEAPKDKVAKLLVGSVFVGVHNRDGEGWTTIKGVPLEESGYCEWGPQQPNGGDKERCGAMFYEGKLNDVECDIRAFYICEHDIRALSNSYNDRFGENEDQ